MATDAPKIFKSRTLKFFLLCLLLCGAVIVGILIFKQKNVSYVGKVQLIATPISGTAPLKVIFSGTIKGEVAGQAPFYLDPGNGSSASFVGLSSGGSTRSLNPTSVQYNSPGTYIAKLEASVCSGSPTSGSVFMSNTPAATCTPGPTMASIIITVTE